MWNPLSTVRCVLFETLSRTSQSCLYSQRHYLSTSRRFLSLQDSESQGGTGSGTGSVGGSGTTFNTTTSSSNSTGNENMQIIKDAIQKTLSENPELKESNLWDSHKAQAHESYEYGKHKLSQENVMVDTYALIKVLKSQGFSAEQAECITYTFTQLMNDALCEQRKLCVEKAALDIMREQIMAHVTALRKDMTILEKSELSDLRNENDKLKLLLSQTKTQIIEEVNKVKNQLTLDINMERSRAKEDFTTTEKSIGSLTTKMTAELGNLETVFERYKNDIYKFIAGSLVSAITIGLGIYRVWKS